MKLLNFIAATLLLLISFANSATAHVSLDYPSGGETFESGSTINIKWHAIVNHGINDWDLLFSTDGGSTWESIVSNLPEQQLDYDWTVPDISTSTAEIKVVQDNNNGIDYEDASGNFTITTATGITDKQNSDFDFKLYSAYPNPFNPTTTIKYEVEIQQPTTIKIYNVLGNEVAILVNEEKVPGTYEVKWNASGFASGVYYYTLRSGNLIKTKKLMFLK